MLNRLLTYRQQLDSELVHILDYWIKYSVDRNNGGFFGRIDSSNTVDVFADKGAVLNCRILWSFSSAYRMKKNDLYREMAERAFNYISAHFIDPVYGGVYWTLDFRGRPANTDKRLYASFFGIYGLSEYAATFGCKDARMAAISLFRVVEEYGHDPASSGYFEAFSRNWEPASYSRLSEKDANEKKSANTHLHALEAFTSLYRIWASEEVLLRIKELLFIFTEFIIADSGHLHLFFCGEWKSQSPLVSYGHDIEAAWLLAEAATVTGDIYLQEKIKAFSLKLIHAARTGLDKDGGLWYEYNSESGELVKEKHWWPQAEAMVGLFYAWQLTGNENLIQECLDTWTFIQQYLIDRQSGEWLWGITADHCPMPGEDKIGLWKCPYHNTRACIELIRRIENG